MHYTNCTPVPAPGSLDESGHSPSPGLLGELFRAPPFCGGSRTRHCLALLDLTRSAPGRKTGKSVHAPTRPLAIVESGLSAARSSTPGVSAPPRSAETTHTASQTEA